MDKIIKINGQNLKLTHLDKLIWPKSKICKSDLIDYYQRVAKYILPYLRNRPVTVQRCPNGINKECWIQKDAPENLPAFVKTYSAVSKTNSHKVDYILVNNLATLLWLANLGSIEFHIWFSTIKAVQKPDWFCFDLDLVGKAKFSDMVEVAFLIKEELAKRDLEGWPKTSGKSGLHILVPIKPEHSYKKVRDFVRKLILDLDKKYPEKIATEARIAERKGNVFVDPAQNSKGRTMICPYSLRATEKATVSAPVEWSKLRGLDAEKFNIKTMQERLKSKGDILKSILSKKQTLKN